MKLLLASKSPRRRELLEQAEISFDLVALDIEETYPEGLSVEEIAMHIAKNKAQAAAHYIVNEEVVLAADTIVAKGKVIYGKPENREHAITMLQELSGDQHLVTTGVCMLSKEKEVSFSATTKVYFNELSVEEIVHYVDEYKPFDKAGAYAIQEWIGLNCIEKIEGCYFNVVGLPVSQVYQRLKEL